MSSPQQPSTTDASEILEIQAQPSEDFELESLPESQSDSDDLTASESDFSDSDAERQWKESLEQLELLLSLVIVPYAGKYFGRKFAYWGAFVPLYESMMGKSAIEVQMTNMMYDRLEEIHGMDVSG